jgi:hypothetical protein
MVQLYNKRNNNHSCIDAHKHSCLVTPADLQVATPLFNRHKASAEINCKGSKQEATIENAIKTA